MMIDLTRPMTENHPAMAWAKQQDNVHVAMGHIGTHLDTYEKTNIPITYCKSRGILFDVREKAEIGLQDIEINQIQQGDFVLFRTGRTEKFIYGEQAYFANHPQLSWELISYLLKKEIHFIGVDCAGIRQNAEHEKADRMCEQSGVYVIENICGLEKLQMYAQKEFMVYTMWLDDAKMTGLRCRVIGEVNMKRVKTEIGMVLEIIPKSTDIVNWEEETIKVQYIETADGTLSGDEITKEKIDGILQEIANGTELYLYTDDTGEEDYFEVISDGEWLVLGYSKDCGQENYYCWNETYADEKVWSHLYSMGQSPVEKYLTIDDIELGMKAVAYFIWTGELYPAMDWAKQIE